MLYRAVFLLLPAIVFAQKPPASWQLSNDSIELTLNADGAFNLLERSSGKRWNGATPAARAAVERATVHPDHRLLEATIEVDGLSLQVNVSLPAAEPEFDLTLSAPPGT